MRTILFSVCLFITLKFSGQELFPLNDPASTIPKGAIGLRAFSNAYSEKGTIRGLYAIRVMYGLLPKLTIMATPNISNHHGDNFPSNLATHTHKGNQTNYSTGSYRLGTYHPYRFNGVTFNLRYRFLTRDGQNKHFRIAAYGTYALLNVWHDEAEPNLMDDTKGFGGGLIATYLVNKFAASFTGGLIQPQKKNGTIIDPVSRDQIPTEVKYGRAAEYNLSLGYLLCPRTYESYKQTNWNIYLEFMGKAYEKAKITQYGVKDVPVSTPLLSAGNYVDICPGVQAIFNSNLRVDFSMKFPMINRSYAHFYPLISVAVQRYFFPQKIKKSKDISN